LDGQDIFGGQFNYVNLEKSPELIGDSCSISLSQEANSAAVWTINVEVHLAQGKFRLGTFTTLSPLSGQPASRVVAVANCPGAIGWAVICTTTTAAEIAGLTLDSSKCCGNTIGVEEVTQTPIPGAGVTLLGPFPLATLEADRPWTNNFSIVLANSFVVKASPGIIRSNTVRVDSTLATGTYYVQFWDAAAPPVDGTAVTLANSLTAPVKVIHVSGVNDIIEYNFDEYGVTFDNGASLNLSSTEFTKTTVAGAFLSVESAEYR
jgi:hypothetical protein